MAKCAACPVNGPCVVERAGHERFCSWASEGLPERVAAILTLSGEAPAPAPPGGPSEIAIDHGRPPPCPPPPPPPAGRKPRLTVDDLARLRAEARRR